MLIAGSLPKWDSIHRGSSDRLSTECEADALPPHSWITRCLVTKKIGVSVVWICHTCPLFDLIPAINVARVLPLFNWLSFSHFGSFRQDLGREGDELLDGAPLEEAEVGLQTKKEIVIDNTGYNRFQYCTSHFGYYVKWGSKYQTSGNLKTQFIWTPFFTVSTVLMVHMIWVADN